MLDSHRAGASILRRALVAGLAVLLGIGLLKVFSGALPQEASATPPHPAPQVAATTSSWNVTVFTTDKLIMVTLGVDPNRSGPNHFTVVLTGTSMGSAITHASATLFITMLDMKMATTSIVMHAVGGGHFLGSGDLQMGGDWDIRIQIRTADQRLHEARIQLLIPR